MSPATVLLPVVWNSFQGTYLVNKWCRWSAARFNQTVGARRTKRCSANHLYLQSDSHICRPVSVSECFTIFEDHWLIFLFLSSELQPSGRRRRWVTTLFSFLITSSPCFLFVFFLHVIKAIKFALIRSHILAHLSVAFPWLMADISVHFPPSVCAKCGWM